MPEIGFQLYSILPYLDTEENLEKSLEKVAQIGYRYVQLQGVPANISDNSIASALKKAGLRCIATQEDYPFGFGQDPERAIERALVCGADYLSFSMIPPQINTLDRLKRFARAIEKIYNKVQKAGLIFAYHPVEIDYRMLGKAPIYDRLLSLLPEQIQLNFCVHSSFRKVPYTQILEKYQGRVDLIHFMDSVIRSDGAVQFMPLGEGEHNWKTISDACIQAGAKYIFAEQAHWDRDMFVCAEENYKYLKELGL